MGFAPEISCQTCLLQTSTLLTAAVFSNHSGCALGLHFFHNQKHIIDAAHQMMAAGDLHLYSGSESSNVLRTSVLQ